MPDTLCSIGLSDVDESPASTVVGGASDGSCGADDVSVVCAEGDGERTDEGSGCSGGGRDDASACADCAVTSAPRSMLADCSVAGVSSELVVGGTEGKELRNIRIL